MVPVDTSEVALPPESWSSILRPRLLWIDFRALWSKRTIEYCPSEPTSFILESGGENLAIAVGMR